jgi:hypothetical protein
VFNASRTAAFILPLALVIGVSVLLLGGFLIEQALFAREMQSHQDRHEQARDTIRWHVPRLIGYLQKNLEVPHATSALIKHEDQESTYSLIIAGRNEAGKLVWNDPYSASVSARFQSPVSGFHYRGNHTLLSPVDSQRRTSLGWAFEDIGLAPVNHPPPEWWPWPSWSISSVAKQESIRDSFQSITGQQWDSEAWVPNGSPIPFDPDASPAKVPVITHVNLRYGIFATGPVDKARKVVRIRFYIDCGIWNPYNRPIRFHEMSGMNAAFMVRIANMPSVRIHNRSTGMSTEWIPLDTCRNANTGESGIHAWVRTNRMIGPGESLTLSEPDKRAQPEGLARTLHPAFPVGPADEIGIDFKQSKEGITVTCDPIEGTSGEQGSADWFHASVSGNTVPPLHFVRADDPNRPFYLESGSLSFRLQNTHQQILVSRPKHVLQGLSDPREQQFYSHHPIIDAAGNQMPIQQLLNTNFQNLRRSSHHSHDPPPAISILSWPGAEPDSLIQATDLTEWNNAFLLGSPDATTVNDFFMTKWPHQIDTIEREIPIKGAFTFAHTLPVNSVSQSAWQEALAINARNPDESVFGYPKFAHPQNAADYWNPDSSHLKSAIGRLVRKIERDPSISIPDFFNRGKLVHAFAETYGEDPLMRFAPVRGLLRKSPPLVPHGSAWILHMAVSNVEDGKPINKSARVWLLKTPDSQDSNSLQIIHFEWTDPEKAVQWMIN